MTAKNLLTICSKRPVIKSGMPLCAVLASSHIIYSPMPEGSTGPPEPPFPCVTFCMAECVG